MADTRAQAMVDVDGEVAPIMIYECRACARSGLYGDTSSCRLTVRNCTDYTTSPFQCPLGCDAGGTYATVPQWEHVKGAT
jgi:hypothetical protein